MSHPTPHIRLRPRALARGSALCVALASGALAATGAALAMTSHAGWPPDQHLIMDKGPAGRSNLLTGQAGVHNYLLGGYGNDTIDGGSSGDVIWGDYHPTGYPAHQVAYIHAGDGPNFIYANDSFNYVWTGTNPRTVVHAHEDSGVIHCENPGIVVYTSHKRRSHWKLIGCHHVSYFTVGH